MFHRDGSHRGLVVLGRDITGRKAAERGLAESEARHRTLVEVSPYGIQEVHTAGHIRFANPASARILGYSQERLTTMTVMDLLPPGERAGFLAFIRDAVARQPPPEPLENENLTADGRRIHVRVNRSYLRDAEGRVLGAFAVYLGEARGPSPFITPGRTAPPSPRTNAASSWPCATAVIGW